MIDEIKRINKIKKERNNMSIRIGKARFGGNNFQRKYFKLKDGEQAYRILPPLGGLADSGRWSMFYNVHYGYKTTDGKQKPFLSPEVRNRTSKAIEVQDAAKERIETLKIKWEEAKKSGNEAVFKKLNDLVGPTGMYNLDNNHYMNVVDAQGNVGVLKLRHKAKLALETEIKKLNAKNIDPLGVEDGRYFVFTRSGMGRDTTFSVSVLKEKLNVAGVGEVERDVIHKLDDDLIKRLAAEAGELDKLFKRLTAEEVKKVVETSDLMTGVSPYMDELFRKANPNQTPVEEPSDEDSVVTPDTVVSAPAQVAPVTAAVTPIQVAKPAPIVLKPTPAKSTAQAVTEMSQDEFLEMLNNGTL
jgi:hypothetical protein